MICSYCEKPLNVETAKEMTRFQSLVRKVKLYRCLNPQCVSLPYFYEENTVEVDSYDLNILKVEDGS